MSQAPVLFRKTLDAQAADILRARIADGVLLAGHRLTEHGLANEFGLSRGTVRTALKQLMSEGFVCQKPYRGWEVAPLSSTDAFELQTLRQALEGTAAELAAEHLDANGKLELAAAFEALKGACEAGEHKAAARQDFELHQTIVRLSGHRRLLQYYEMIARQIQRYIFSSDALLRSDMELVAQHKPIVNAIIAGDVSAAYEESRKHNESEGKLLVEHLLEIEADRALDENAAQRRSG